MPDTIDTALLRGYGPGIAAYRDQLRRLQREALLGGGEVLERLLAGRAAALARLRSAPWLRALSDATLRQMRTVVRSGAYACALPLRAGDLARLMELALPGLADDTVLHHPTHARAADIIPELPLLRGRADAVRQVLAQSSLDEPTTFRTVDDEHSRPVVHGQDGPTLGALAGVAHELGHCLYERARPVRTARGQLASERLAHRWEEQVVAAYLAARGGAEERRLWWLRQRRVDALNLHFFLAERAELYGPHDGFEALVSPRAGVFRESLFTVPGYQVVYARASLARLHTGDNP
ncbi:hypothetical protein QA942_27575 [Streptomyces sp. B21-106]|uniref:hypothetical protein n=1 Tax=unclassified Streptomyces TaxID=2593676 RepID=UPI002FF36849